MIFIKKHLLVFIIGIVIAVPVFISFTYYNLNEKYDFSDNTFNHETITGYVYVKGYIDTIQLEKEMGVPDGEKYDYLMFRVLETKSDEFKEFLKEFSSSGYFDLNGFGIGCYENRKIEYTTITPELDEINLSLNWLDSRSIMKSTKDKPVVLKLEYSGRTMGRCGPMCFSYASNIEVVR